MKTSQIGHKIIVKSLKIDRKSAANPSQICRKYYLTAKDRMPDVYRYAHSSRFCQLGRWAPIAGNSGLRPETRCVASDRDLPSGYGDVHSEHLEAHGGVFQTASASSRQRYRTHRLSGMIKAIIGDAVVSVHAEIDAALPNLVMHSLRS